MQFEFDQSFWVAVGFLIFLCWSARPISRLAASGLDKRRAKIEADLAEAARLRDEAQAMLAEYQRRQREAHAEAETLLASARETVRAMEQQAEETLRLAVEARTRAAEEKIARREHELIQQMRKRIVDAAITSATAMFEGELNEETHEKLLALAAKDASRLLH